MTTHDLGDGITLYESDEWRDPNNKLHQPQYGQMASRRAQDVKEFIGHWTGESEQARLRHPNPVEWIRRICEYHRAGRRYSDIAYNVAIVVDADGPFDGNVFELRSGLHRGGHTVANPPDGIDHNMRGCGVVFLVMQPGNVLTEKAKLAARKVYGLVTLTAGAAPIALVHRNVAPTACPGDDVTWFFATDLLTPAPKPTGPDPQPEPEPAPRTPLDEHPYPGHLIVEGDKGQRVVEVQYMLHYHGFGSTVGEADGDFGPRTKRAVIDFQRSRNLVPDGIVGPKTWTALFTV